LVHVDTSAIIDPSTRRVTVPGKYKNPPIVEAVCEFQFERDSDWSSMIPDQLYQKLGGEGGSFPTRRIQKRHSISINLNSPEQEVPSVSQAEDRSQFVREDGTALVQVGKHLLAVNHLRPYPSWNLFKPLVDEALSGYMDIAKPTGIHRVGLRYVNKIHIPATPFKLADYLTYVPNIPNLEPELPDSCVGFSMEVRIPFPDGEECRDTLKIAASGPFESEDGGSDIILDLDYYLASPGGIDHTGLDTWIEDAHRRLDHCFESCITERTRELFGKKAT
jgi:uncharacterized protein (TIGR04255 family)